MSNLKRLVSSILVLAMIATSGVFTLGAFAESETASDATKTIELTEEDIAVANKLKTFGIIDAVDEGTLVSNVLRGETVALLMNYLGMRDTGLGSATSPFYDVSVEDEDIDAYNVLYNAGYISGDGSKMFHPTKELTYNEAITLVINVMGYKVFAIRNGGYPEGYLYTANKNDLLGGLRGDGNDPIPYCDLYLLLERSLKADAVAERIYTGDGEAQFILREGYTVLEELFGIKELKGIVTGSENTRLFAADSSLIGMNQIEIEGKVYDTPGKIYADYLGMYVAAYGRKNDRDEYEVVYLEPVERRNNEYQISAEDLLPAKTTNERIYYTDEEYKEKHVKVSSTSFSVIYNGKMESGYGPLKNVLPTNGFIRGLDNTGDEVIDVLFVYEFENYVVGAVDLFNNKIFDKYDTSKSIVADPVADDVRIYDADNNQITIRDLQIGDVLSIMKSKNTSGYKLIMVYISKETVSGAVEELLDNGAYVIGGKTYELAQNMNDYIDDGDIPPLNLGMNATFYLDIEGKISYYVMGTTTTNTYGFIAGVDSELGIDNVIRVKIYTQSGFWEELTCVNPINIDGYKYKLDTETQLNTAVSKIPIGEVVLFNKADGLLNYIDTKELNKGNLSKAADAGNLNEIISGTGFFQRSGMCFSNSDMSQDKFVAKSGKVIIFVTPDRSHLLEDLTKYSILTSIPKNRYTATSSGRDFEQVLTDGFVAYNLADADIDVASCLLLRGTGVEKTVSSSAKLAVVSKITSATDKDGMKRTKIYYTISGGAEEGKMLADVVGYSYGKPGEATAVETPFADMGLEVGDVINVIIDNDDFISVINVVYRQNRLSPKVAQEWISPGDVDMDIHSQTVGGSMGTIVAYDTANNYLQFAAGVDEFGEPITYNISTEGASISVYRHSAKLEVRAKATDLIPGDKVLIVTKEYNKLAQQIIILK